MQMLSGNTIIRFTNDDVRYSLNGVVAEIENVINDLMNQPEVK
jgi:very-short-patch-repair endonuclease